MFLFQFVACQGVLIALVSSHNVADHQDMPKSVSMTMLDTIVVGYWSFLMYLSRWEVSFPLEYILVTFTVDSHSILFILTYQPSRWQRLQQNWLFWAFWNKGVLWRTYLMNWLCMNNMGPMINVILGILAREVRNWWDHFNFFYDQCQNFEHQNCARDAGCYCSPSGISFIRTIESILHRTTWNISQIH